MMQRHFHNNNIADPVLMVTMLGTMADRKTPIGRKTAMAFRKWSSLSVSLRNKQ